MNLLVHTLRAQLSPRRLIPVLILAIPLMIAQRAWSPERSADLVAVAMVLTFFLVGPWSYRALHGEIGFRGALRQWGWLSPGPWLRLGLFGLAGGLPAFVGVIVERFSQTPSFLTSGVNLLVLCALGWVGSWGLGRDIQQEVRIDAERDRADALQREADHARLLALDAHLDPHFLFNTLNAIAEWVREDPVHAERAILDLSALLREILEGVRQPRWSLDREVQLALGVWRLHGVRDPVRYQFTYDAPESLPEIMVPPLLLLPIVENAIKHGPAAGNAGPLSMRVWDTGQQLRVEVSNPGIYAGPREGGQGLGIAARRLALTWGRRASVNLETRGDRTVATLILPRESP